MLIGVVTILEVIAASAVSSPIHAAPAGVADVEAEEWVARYNGPGNVDDYALALGMSPDGTRVYLTGFSREPTTRDDYTTIAYDAADGAELWVARYDGPTSDSDQALALAVSPDGTRVYVTGGEGFAGDDLPNYATVAYDAANGAELWVARYDGPGGGSDSANALAVSPDGTRVYVTGASEGSGTGDDYATVAYDAAIGAELWVARLGGTGTEAANAIGLSPDGSLVFVTGFAFFRSHDYATAAHDATTGARQWVARYDGPGRGYDAAQALAVGPDGASVFVTGVSDASMSGTNDDYATVAYAGATGSRMWISRYDDRFRGGDTASDIAVSPDSSMLYVTGASWGGDRSEDVATISVDASNGAPLWVARYDGLGHLEDDGEALTVSPDGSRVYVTGTSIGAGGEDYVMIAYDGGTGIRLGVARYDGGLDDNASDLAVSADGAMVFVTGNSIGQGTSNDYATVGISVT